MEMLFFFFLVLLLSVSVDRPEEIPGVERVPQSPPLGYQAAVGAVGVVGAALVGRDNLVGVRVAVVVGGCGEGRGDGEAVAQALAVPGKEEKKNHALLDYTQAPLFFFACFTYTFTF